MTNDWHLEYEFTTTNYSSPDRKHGQHTNGPQQVFVRECDYFAEPPMIGDWIATGSCSRHRVTKEVAEHGLTRIIAGTFQHERN